MEEGGGMPGQNRSLWGAREAAGAVEGQVVEKGWPGTAVSERAGGSGPEQVIGAEGGQKRPTYTHLIALTVAGRLCSPLQGGCEKSGDVQKALAWE